LVCWSGDSYIFILQSSAILFMDGVFDFFKPSCEGHPHYCNFLQLDGVLLSSGGVGSFSVDFSVIGFLLRGLAVI
jgi:hypothetical protein